MGVGGPIAAGKVASMAGTSRIAFDVGAAMLGVCVVVYWMFRKVIEPQVAIPLASPS
jgi:hypothetical protein